MRLRKFRVQAFRCIHDSGNVVVGDLAAFVGRNESGKTTILQALTMLDKDEVISELDLCDEMTERLKSEIRIVEGDFELNQDETEIVKEKFPGLQLKKLKIFRTNKNPEIQYDFGDIKIDQKEDENLEYWQNITKQLSNFVESIPNYISKKLDTDFFTGNTPKDKKIIQAELDEFDNTLQAIATEEQQVISEWEETYTNIIKNVEKILIDNTESEALKNFIIDNLHPRFVYFSDYKKILGNINLAEYIKESENAASSGIEYIEGFDRAETVRNLLYLAELEIEKLEELKNSPSKLIKFLNTASKNLTQRLNPSWKGEAINVELRLNPGNILSVVLSDVHKDGTITNTGLLNRRAEGFKWTFSFIVNFAAETQRSELKEAILLLDEPARNLHPTQQAGISDLLKNLAGSNQVLYATHSPFMIFDYTPGNLLVVELDRKTHLSKIFYEYWKADDATLTPILYGLSKGLVDSITDREVGNNSRPLIIVETMSDTMYLNAFDKFLQDPNISMNPLNVVPAYTKNSVLPLAIFYHNHGYNTFVLLDNDYESNQIAVQLKNNKFSETQIIFFERDGNLLQSMEDYMVTEDYLYAVNQTYEIKLRREGFTNLTKEEVLIHGKNGIIENLKAVWNEHSDDDWGEFEKEEVCRYISGKIALGDASFLTEKTRDRLRTLYRLIAERIRQYQRTTPTEQFSNE
uniref:Putative ATP-dependent endonuclease n=1 Tax=uncultured marine thaumarchaeote KM3_15_E09 TaxID=1456028 RepID=A0A075GMF4_9ARCH|nr:putative ATP-dependent endonuclease [uncultured marine thaumarchaeote KM3_15_E09]